MDLDKVLRDAGGVAVLIAIPNGYLLIDIINRLNPDQYISRYITSVDLADELSNIPDRIKYKVIEEYCETLVVNDLADVQITSILGDSDINDDKRGSILRLIAIAWAVWSLILLAVIINTSLVTGTLPPLILYWLHYVTHILV